MPNPNINIDTILKLPIPEFYEENLEGAIAYANYVFSVLCQNPDEDQFEISYIQGSPHICVRGEVTPYNCYIPSSIDVSRQELMDNLRLIGNKFGKDFLLSPQLNLELLVDEDTKELSSFYVFVPDEFGNLTIKPPRNRLGRFLIKLLGDRENLEYTIKDFGLSGLSNEQAI